MSITSLPKIFTVYTVYSTVTIVEIATQFLGTWWQKPF